MEIIEIILVGGLVLFLFLFAAIALVGFAAQLYQDHKAQKSYDDYLEERLRRIKNVD